MQAAESTTTREDPKEEKILAAAAEAFLELGYAACSMDHVAQRARASKTTVYTRFPSKEALFAATIRSACERRLSAQLDAYDGLPIDEALRRIGRQFIDLIWSPEAMRMEQIITGEAPRFPEVARLFYEHGPQRVRGLVAAFFERAASRGLIAVSDPVFAAGQFLAACKGMPHCEGLACVRDEFPPEERGPYVAKVVALFLDGVRPH